MASCAVGIPATIFFLWQINEPKLIAESRRIYDKYFMLDDMDFPLGKGQTFIDFDADDSIN